MKLHLREHNTYYCLIAFLWALPLVASMAIAAPVINFTDIDSGPKNGNTDGANGLTSLQHGAIVTLWGNNLGSTQGTSKVFIGSVEAAHYYYWKDANGSLPGGPADLTTYHKMQEIAFSIPADAVDGVTTIRVVVNGVISNALPFTVRPGNILFVAPSGKDAAGRGSWDAPFLTLNYVMGGGNGAVAAGDIVYSVGAGSTAGVNVGRSGGIKGTAANPVSLIAYPNTSVDVSGMGYDGAVIYNYYYTNPTYMSEYVHFSKLSVTASGATGNCNSDPVNGLVTTKGNRIVGMEFTGPTVYGGYGGAITCTNGHACGGGKYLGIYMHHYGQDNGWVYSPNANAWTSPTSSCYYAPHVPGTARSTVDRFQHLYYISNRTVTKVDAYEIGWNYLTDNPILHGIHIYDMGNPTAGWNGIMRIHNNVVRNQRGSAVDVSFPGTATLHIYNNIIISDAKDAYTGSAFDIQGNATAYVYNNTIFGYNYVNILRSSYVDYRNNVMVDTKGKQFIYDTIASQSNNLFYSKLSTSKPAWATPATGGINSDPLFVDEADFNFALSADSPAKTAGTDLTIAIAPFDFLGRRRTSGSVSVGAFNFTDAAGSNPRMLPPGNLRRP